MHTTLKKISITGCVLLLSIIATEGYLRLTIPFELALETWFTPGIHTPDPQFGFVFTPHYHGHMRHPDGVWGVPLHLDQHGFRNTPSRSSDHPAKRIVMIGGMSMLMGFGLPDHQTIPGCMASQHPLDIQNTAWAGFDLYRNWHLYLQKLGSEPPPDLVILSIYGNHSDMLAHFAQLPDDFTQMPVPFQQRHLFYFFNNLVIQRQGPLAQALGPMFYASYIGYRLFHATDRRLITMGLGKPLQGPAQTLSTPPTSEGCEKFVSFIEHVSHHFQNKGTKLLVVFLPIRNTSDTFYTSLVEALPPHIPYLDLHREQSQTLAKETFIADGHYGREQSLIIATRLVKTVDAILNQNQSIILSRQSEKP